MISAAYEPLWSMSAQTAAQNGLSENPTSGLLKKYTQTTNMRPGVPRITSTTAAAGSLSHQSFECRMAPNTTANIQQPTQLMAKISSVS